MQRDIALIARNLFSDEPDRRIEAGPIETLVRFGAGALSYALDGGMQKIADKVFLLTPRNVEVSAAQRAELLEKGFFNQS